MLFLFFLLPLLSVTRVCASSCFLTENRHFFCPLPFVCSCSILGLNGGCCCCLFLGSVTRSFHSLKTVHSIAFLPNLRISFVRFHLFNLFLESLYFFLSQRQLLLRAVTASLRVRGVLGCSVRHRLGMMMMRMRTRVRRRRMMMINERKKQR